MNRSTSDTFRLAVAQTAHDLAATLRDTDLLGHRRQALGLLASYLQNSLDRSDQRLVALAACQPTRDTYKPGPYQSQTLANFGALGSGPEADPAEMLHALLAAAVDDFAEALRAQVRGIAEQRDRQAGDVLAAQRERDALRPLEAEVHMLRTDNERLQRELDRMGRAVEVLSQIPTEGPAGQAAKRSSAKSAAKAGA